MCGPGVTWLSRRSSSSRRSHSRSTRSVPSSAQMAPRVRPSQWRFSGFLNAPRRMSAIPPAPAYSTPRAWSSSRTFVADGLVRETLLRCRGPALLDPGRDRDEEAGRGPLVGVGVEGDVEALGPRVVDELEHLLRRPGERGPVVEVGDVGRRAAPPPDVDRLAERVQEPVAERVPDVGVVDAVEARGLGGELRQLPGRRVRARRVVEPRRDARRRPPPSPRAASSASPRSAPASARRSPSPSWRAAAPSCRRGTRR